MITPRTENPDYTIIGAGCAGLSLILRMIRSGKFEDKKIVLIDQSPKTVNDRTWCFWENGNGFFEEIVYRKWPVLHFYSRAFSSALDIAPYAYKMIRGIDFYRYCFEEIRKHNNIEIIYGEVKDISSREDNRVISFDSGQLNVTDGVVFNSIYIPAASRNNRIHLLQHFKGWIIKSAQPAFNVSVATLMDFRVHQDHGTAFAYTLPLTESTALVEYTLFTGRLLENQEYDVELKKYIRQVLRIEKYSVESEEFGVIPMTNERFRFHNNGQYFIGTAGGQTKASTGYTFQFIQKQSEAIVNCLLEKKSLEKIPPTIGRFLFYDSVLLRLLAGNELSGDKIFSTLFAKNKASKIFKFLDNETSLVEELKLISTLPTRPFLKAAMNIRSSR